MQEYTTIDIQRIFGIDRQRLREWIDKRYIFPSISQAAGVGTKNIFSRWDIYGIEIFRTLIDTGLSRKDAKEIYYYWSHEFNNKDIEYRKILACLLIIHNLKPKKFKPNIKFDEVITYFVTKDESKKISINTITRDKYPDLTRWEIMDIDRIIKDVDLLLE